MFNHGLSPLQLLEYQVAHYRQRLADARRMNRPVEERAFLRKEYHNLKTQLQKFYN